MITALKDPYILSICYVPNPLLSFTVYLLPENNPQK